MFKNFSKILLFSVFITGGCVMVLEITAIRLFAPFFGNTLYTTSSIIGVILGALSLGYYVGGIFADKYPRKDVFFTIIVLSGLFVLFLHTAHKVLLPLFAYKFSISVGSLFFSLTFFLIPNFLFGMLSPFAIKLRSEVKGSTAGKNSGEVFFASTVGSIAGSFLTGFYLIPTYGVDRIIVSTSILLVVLGVCGIAKRSNKEALLFVLSSLFLILLNNSSSLNNKNTIYSEDGVYQKIKVIDSIYKGRLAMFLYQDLNPSSAMYKDSPELVFSYTKYIDVINKLPNPPKTVLVLGAGAYSIPKHILENYPTTMVDVVDIEPFLYPVAKKYFKLSESPRLKNIVSDGRIFLQKNSKKYDVIFVDTYGSFLSIPSHLSTIEFFELLNKNTREGGAIIANVIGRKNGPFINSMENSWISVFPNSTFYAVEDSSLEGLQNFIFLTCTTCNISSYKINNRIYPTKKKGEILLTDNYSPIDYLIGKDLE